MIEPHEIKQLRQPFTVDAHSVRQGPTSSKGDKCMWFLYIDRFAIIDRLDELFPGEWEYAMTPPVERANHYSSVGTLTIRGIARSFNGAFEKKDKMKDHDTEKSCGTDTWRRVAAQWGIGSYLAQIPVNMWTAKPAKGDWDAEKKAKAEILNRLNQWLNKTYGNGNQPDPQPEATGESTWPSKNTVQFVVDWFVDQQGLEPSEILKLANVESFDDGDGWRKFADSKAAIQAIWSAFDAQLETNKGPEQSNGDRPAVYTCTFTHMAYVVNGKAKYLGFANMMPSENATHPDLTIIRAYGRTSNVKKWLGAFAYKELGLDQYTGADRTTPFTEMSIPVEFEYIQKTTKTGDPYLNATGVVGNEDF